nr:hypothetical protein [Tanacetum cinerariifolium]
MENVNPSSPTPKNGFLGLEKELEVESRLKNSRSFDSLVNSDKEFEEEIEEEEDIGEFIVSGKAEVVMGKPFRNVTYIEYDCVKGLVSFTGIFGPEYQVDKDMKEWLI